MPLIKVLIVDDHTLFRKGLMNLLQQQKGIEVVGEARDGREGVLMAKTLKPDVILMDVEMPNQNGIQATQAIREMNPDARIMMLTVSEEDEDLFSAIKAGARGYLVKNVEPDQLIQAIGLLAKGEPVISHTMASKVLTEFNNISKSGRGSREPDQKPLTAREQDVLRRLAKGETNKEIGNHLYISEYTVKIHLRNVLKKLHMNNRVQAAVYAYQKGLVPPSEDGSSS